MDWTGSWNSFYSTKPINVVFSEWRKKMIAINYKSYYNAWMGDEWLFSYKNNEMLEYHYENGYNIDMQGEGCVTIEAKKVSLNAVATLIEFERETNFEPYNINLHLKDLYYYVLVLPEELENSEFSRKLHELFISVLKV